MKDYSEWVAGLRHRPTIFDAEEVLKKDYPLKLPDRRYIHMWNSPEISEFRGVQTNINAFEDRQATAVAEHAQIMQIGREQGLNTVDISQVADILSRQERGMSALNQSVADLNTVHARQEEGRRQEMQSMFERLAVGQAGAENRANVAQQASQNMVDMLMADRGRVMSTVTNAGGVVNNVDSRQVDSSTHYHQTFVDQTTHNRMLQLIQDNQQQFGTYMQQQNLNQDQMMGLLHRYASQRPEMTIQYLRPDVPMLQAGPSPMPSPEDTLAIRQNRGVVRAATGPAMVNPQPPGPPGPGPGPSPPGAGANLPSGAGPIRPLGPERYGPWSGTQKKYRPPSRAAAAAAAIPKEAPRPPPPVQEPVPVAPTPEPIPVPTIGARAKTPEALKKGPKPRAKAAAQEQELVPQAVPKPRGRSAKRDEEDPRLVPPKSKAPAPLPPPDVVVPQVKPRGRSATKKGPRNKEEVPVAEPKARSRSAKRDEEDPRLVPPRSRSRKASPGSDIPDRIPQVKPRARSAKKAPDASETPVEPKRAKSRSKTPAHKETPFPDTPLHPHSHTARFDPDDEDMIPVPRVPKPSRSGKNSKMKRIAQALAPDVLTTPSVTPGKMPKGGLIPAAGPQGNRQPKVMKVKVHPINKYAVLKQNAKAPAKAAKMKTALESYAKFKQGRAPKSLEILHDLRGSMVTA